MILWSLLRVLRPGPARWRSPPAPPGVPSAALTAVMLYTHYWGLYLVVGRRPLWLLFGLGGPRAAARRSPHRPRAARERPTNSCGAWSPWSWAASSSCPGCPSFIFQTLHTGTPWANAAGPGDILGVLSEYSGGRAVGNRAGLDPVHPAPARAVRALHRRPPGCCVELHTRRRVRPIACDVLRNPRRGRGLLGVVARAAFVGRYTAVVFPLFILHGRRGRHGLRRPQGHGRRAGLVTSLCGIVVGIDGNTSPRTQAVQVAAVINQVAQPGRPGRLLPRPARARRRPAHPRPGPAGHLPAGDVSPSGSTGSTTGR